MNGSIGWLDHRITLVQNRETLQLHQQLQQQDLEALYRQIPMEQIIPGSFVLLEQTLNRQEKYLQELYSLQTPLQVTWSDQWIQQYQQIILWKDILERYKEKIITYEECLLQLEQNQIQLKKNWVQCPIDFRSALQAEDTAASLQSFRFSLLFDLEEESDESNPAHNPFLLADIRHRAKCRYLGIDLKLPIVDSHTQIKAEEALQFQVEWLARLPQLLQDCTEQEIAEIEIPTVPYSQESITRCIEQLNQLQEKRRAYFPHLLRKKYRIDGELERSNHIAKRINQGQPFVEMVHIQSGRFRLSSLGEKPYEQKKSFWISLSPVSVRLYSSFFTHVQKKSSVLDMPMTSISWFQALQFCNILSEADGLQACYQLGIGPGHVVWNEHANGYRLPTEFEWEIAAQPGLKYLAPNHKQRYMWGAENSDHMQLMNQRQPNHHGLFDMLGNAWEWCYEPFATPDSDDRIEGLHVVRGGSWRTSLSLLDVGLGEGRPVEGYFGDVGFRIVRNADITQE